MTTTDTLWSQIKEKARGYASRGAQPSRAEAEAIVGELLENVEVAESVPGEALAFYARELLRLSGGGPAAPERVPLVVRLAGDLDSFACDDMRRALRPAARAADVVLDLSEVRHIDSSVLSSLIVLHRDRLKHGLPATRIAGASSSIRRIFAITALDLVWPIFDSVDAAIASFSTEG